MSETLSSRTKSVTDTDESEATDNPLIADRWTNNITYRQLVMSSCISIVQFWWHPYVHDLRRLLPFLFLYNLFSVVVAFPLFYLELALAVVTKKGVLNCWDMSPLARGIGIAMLITSLTTAFAIGIVSAYSLAMFVHSFHSFLPWLHCAAIARPACSARHRPLPEGSETPSQSFFFNFVLNLRREGLEGGMGNIVWELAVYFFISWVLIYFVAFKKVYSYSKLVLFKDVLAYFVLICSLIGVTRLDGAGKMISDCDWNVIFEEFQIWREALQYSLIQMTISQGSLVMLGSYCPKQKYPLAITALVSFASSKTTAMGSALVLGAVHGVLQKDYDGRVNIWKGSSSSIVLWSDLVARIPGSQFWAALIFFTLFVLSVTTAALLVQTVMSTFTGRTMRKLTWAFLILTCLLFFFIGVITLCSQGGLYILNFLMTWPVSAARLPVAAALAATVTYAYGQDVFCEDVYFAVGQYPNVFMRVCWAVAPPLLLISFVSGMALGSPAEATAGWIFVCITLLPILVVLMFYLVFKCRVRNIVGNEK